MSFRRLTRLARSFEQLFPERHLYVRSGGEMRGYVLTTGKQMAAAGAVAACALWMGVSTAAMLVGAMTQNKGEAEASPCLRSNCPYFAQRTWVTTWFP